MKRDWTKSFLWSSIALFAVVYPLWLSMVNPRSVIAGIIQAIVPAAVPTANKQGNASLFQLGSGAVTNGHCGSFDGNGNLVDSGVACSSSGAGTPGSTFFSSTTQTGPNDTAVETSLIGSVSGSTTIAANTFTNGALFKVEGQGYFSLPAVADSLTLKAKCGSTVLGSASFTPAAGSLTNGTFRIWLDITAIGSGAGGAFNTNGIVELTGTSLTDTTAKVLNTANVSFDFTTACTFNLTAQWGGAQVGESMTGTGVVAYVPGAPVTSVGGLTGAVKSGFQGNGTLIQASTGTTTTNDCVKFDANGNTVDAGAACGTSTSADFVRLLTLTPSGVATSGSATVFSSNTTYNLFQIALIDCLNNTSTANFQLRLSTDGSTFDSGTNYDSNDFEFLNGATGTGGGGTGQTLFQLARSASTAANIPGISSTLYVVNPASLKNKHIYGTGIAEDTTGDPRTLGFQYAFKYVTTSAVTGFQVSVSSGTFTGTIVVYGLTH